MTFNKKLQINDNDSFIISATNDDVMLLARLIQAEGESEPIIGKVAIGSVVVNRVRHHDFPNSIFEVIMQPQQFEAVTNSRIFNIDKLDPECIIAAKQALNGEDPTNGAVFFYNPITATNQWIKSKKVNVILGNHNFAI